MAYKTRRRLRLEADAAREDRNKARRELAAAVEKHDMEIRQLGRQLADQQDRIDEVEAHKTNLAAQLDIAHERIQQQGTALNAVHKLMAHMTGSHQTVVPVVQFTAAELRSVDLAKGGEQ